MRKLNLLILFTLFTLIVHSQTKDTAKTPVKNWTKGGLVGLNFAQSSFTNWASGGENSISTTLQINLFTNYKKDKTVWDNTFTFAYGILKSGNYPFRKNEDKIEFSTKYGRYAFKKHWYYTALLDFRSQADNGYNYPDDSTVISHFLAPATVLISIGLDYKTNDNSFSLYISPLTSKTTIVNNQGLADLGLYGVTGAAYDSVGSEYIIVDPGLTLKSDFGGYVKISLKKEIAKNVELATKLELFSNYLLDPQNIDVNWSFLLTAKINKYFNASLSTDLIYDHETPVRVERVVNGVKVKGYGPRLQVKEVLSIGISVKF